MKCTLCDGSGKPPMVFGHGGPWVCGQCNGSGKEPPPPPPIPERDELIFIRSYLAHNDQDANHAWMARRINAVLGGVDPSTVAGWAESDGVRAPRRVDPNACVSAVKTDLGYRLAIPHAWSQHVTITDDEGDALLAALAEAGAGAKVYGPMQRLRDLIDENFGMQPVMTDDEALTFLGTKLFEARRDASAKDRR